MVYEGGGFTQAHFNRIDYTPIATPLGPLGSLPATTFNGWFLGSGFEYAFTFLPIQGLFLKTEYRFSQYQSKTIGDIVTATGGPLGLSESLHPYTQTITTELVYRFNWH